MKTVILAGGLGTRISEESHLLPKPMIEIGGYPILWHIMKIYSSFGFNEFIICAGYKQHIIKEYFANYYLRNSDVTFDFTDSGTTVTHISNSEPWKVTIVDTGFSTQTGGRVKRAKPYIGNDTFMLTYGDGVADIDIPALIKAHESSGKTITLTAVNIAPRFGFLDTYKDGTVQSFREKNDSDTGLVNAGFMVAEPSLIDHIDGDATVLETDVFNNLVAMKELNSYHHTGFWKCMDTQRDKFALEDMWNEGRPPWKLW